MSVFHKMVEVVPEKTIGIARTEHYQIQKFEAMMATLRGQPTSAELVCKLLVGGRLYMSDSHYERATNYTVVRKAHGNVLIAGLGLGMIVHPILAKPEVSSVLVIEKYKDVIDLISPTIPSEKLTITCADIFIWKPAPKRKFNTIYFDIWGDMSTGDLAEQAKLHQRGKCWLDRTDDRCWMYSWNRDNLLRHKRLGR